mmetsp:Transcript_24423/g.35710  ORF Transcript_24423/g.35710 Transcript_24423/m.35710 type:complete len:611 (-) Transcript_24423:99-1931(-)
MQVLKNLWWSVVGKSATPSVSTDAPSATELLEQVQSVAAELGSLGDKQLEPERAAEEKQRLLGELERLKGLAVAQLNECSLSSSNTGTDSTDSGSNGDVAVLSQTFAAIHAALSTTSSATAPIEELLEQVNKVAAELDDMNSPAHVAAPQDEGRRQELRDELVRLRDSAVMELARLGQESGDRSPDADRKVAMLSSILKLSIKHLASPQPTADAASKPLVVYIGVHTSRIDSKTFAWTVYLKEESDAPHGASSDTSPGGTEVPESPITLCPSSALRKVHHVRYTVQYADREVSYEPSDFVLKKTCEVNNCIGVLVTIFAKDAAGAAGAAGVSGADEDTDSMREFPVTLTVRLGPDVETKHTFYFEQGRGHAVEDVRPSRKSLAAVKASPLKPTNSELRAILREHELTPTFLTPFLGVISNGGVFPGVPSFNQCFWISMRHWLLICKQRQVSLRDLKALASLDGAFPVPSAMTQTDLVSHNAALSNLASVLGVLIRVYIYDHTMCRLAVPSAPCALREELDFGDKKLVEDKTKWIVIVHYGNHFELVYLSEQLGYRLDRLHFAADNNSPFEFANPNKLFIDADGQRKTARNLSLPMQRQLYRHLGSADARE